MAIWRSLIFLILGIVAIALLAQGVGADDGALRSDISGLRSRVTRLESEVGTLKSALRQRLPSSPSVRSPSPAPTLSGNTDLSQNPQFKNLAIKVAELQQDLEALENRLNPLAP